MVHSTTGRTLHCKAVNELLQREFGLPMGLADYSTIEHEVVNEQYAKGKKGERPTYKRRFHKVQILDPRQGQAHS